jgi:hypothetical protein
MKTNQLYSIDIFFYSRTTENTSYLYISKCLYQSVLLIILFLLTLDLNSCFALIRFLFLNVLNIRQSLRFFLFIIRFHIVPFNILNIIRIIKLLFYATGNILHINFIFLITKYIFNVIKKTLLYFFFILGCLLLYFRLLFKITNIN